MKDNEFLKQMGAKIKALRKSRKLALDTMAAECKLNSSNLWFIENGQCNPRMLTLKTIAEYYGVEVRDLL